MVDDHEFVRLALCDIVRLLKDGVEVVPFSTGSAVCDEPAGSFDAAVVDLNLPDIPGPIVLRRLSRVQPALTLIAITGSAEPDTIRYALEAGAVTCLSKATGLQDLRVYLHAALLGAIIIDPHTQKTVSVPHPPTLCGPQRPNLLTERELQVLELLARGSTIKSIAEALFIGEATVRTHRHHIYSKLKIQTRLEAMQAYRELVGDRSLRELTATAS